MAVQTNVYMAVFVTKVALVNRIALLL